MRHHSGCSGIRTLCRVFACAIAASFIFLLDAQDTADAQFNLNVPADFPTIQAAIDAAADGDTVLVAPGTYFETIDFRQKEIVVESTGGLEQTIIDGGGAAVTVVLIAMNDRPGKETVQPVLRGFTISNGQIGVHAAWGKTVVEANRIVGHSGQGIYSQSADAQLAFAQAGMNYDCSGPP